MPKNTLKLKGTRCNFCFVLVTVNTEHVVPPSRHKRVFIEEVIHLFSGILIVSWMSLVYLCCAAQCTRKLSLTRAHKPPGGR